MSTTVQHRKFRGIVVSDKMDKTVVVRVDRITSHPKYGKQFKVSKRYHAHDQASAYKVGDKVWIQATRPLSATKRWKVTGKA